MEEGSKKVTAHLMKCSCYDARKGKYSYLMICFNMDDVPDGVPGKADKKVTFVCWSKQPLPEVGNGIYFLHGNWVVGKDGKWRFFSDYFTMTLPKNEKGIISLLSSDYFDLVGDVLAKAIYKQFESETFNVIKNKPEQLVKVPGINLEMAQEINKRYCEKQALFALIEKLSPLGIKYRAIERISEKLGEDSVNLIDQNPYLLLDEGIDFDLVDAIGQAKGIAKNTPQRIQGGVIHQVKQDQKRGNCCINADLLIKNSINALGVSRNDVANAFNKDREENKLICQNGYIFTETSYKAEYSAASKLKEIASWHVNEVHNAEAMLNAYCKAERIELDSIQKEAVINAINNPACIITGGAGTGKTTVIKAVMYLYEQISNNPITLLAPTGKAARRDEEATGHKASTIHSRLHIYDSEEESTELISSGLIVVDEMSMVDIFLMEKLLRAITPGSQLVMLGDINQLPSVGAGKVLADLINSQTIPVTTLQKIYRQEGGVIVENSLKVNKCDYNIEFNDDFKFIDASNDDDAYYKIIDTYINEVDKWGIENVVLLCPRRRVGEDNDVLISSDRLNAAIQDKVNPDEVDKNSLVIGKRIYREKDRIMQWKNTKYASNGDVGTIRAIYHDPNQGLVITICWENGNTTTLKQKDLADTSLAYAMSIHKSQGSEYSSVIIPLISSQESGLKRNLIYTGITRAKKKVTLIGSKTSLFVGMTHADTDNRSTLLKERLKANEMKREEN